MFQSVNKEPVIHSLYKVDLTIESIIPEEVIMRLKYHLFAASAEACLNSLIATGSKPSKQVVLGIKKRNALTQARLLVGCATLTVTLAIVLIPHSEITAQARIIHKVEKPVDFTINKDLLLSQNSVGLKHFLTHCSYPDNLRRQAGQVG